MKTGTPLAPLVELELGGETRHLKLDFNALAQAEEKTGINFLVSRNLNVMTVRSLTAVVWGCLLHESPDLTLEELRSWIGLGNYQPVMTAFRTAVLGSFPKPKDGEGEGSNADPLAAPAKPRRRTGKRSGASASATSDSPTNASGN